MINIILFLKLRIINVSSRNEKRPPQEPLSLDTRAITENLKREIDATIRKMSNASMVDSHNQYYFDANNNNPTARASSAVATASGLTPPPSYGEADQPHEFSSTISGGSGINNLNRLLLANPSNASTSSPTAVDNLEYNILPQMDPTAQNNDLELRGVRNRAGGGSNPDRGVFEISYL